MSFASGIKLTLAGAIIVTAATWGWKAQAQATVAPTNDLPNPYQTINDYFKLPDGRAWGSTSAVDIDKDGKTIWVAERCGTNSCAATPTIDTVYHFDESGKVIKSFGAGLIIFPHGIHVDRDGNIWVTDGNDNGNAAAGGAGRGAGGGGGRGGGRGAADAGAAGAAGAAGGAAADAGAAAAGGGRRGGGGGTGAAGGGGAAAAGGAATGGGAAAQAGGGAAAGGGGGRGPAPTGPNPAATKGHQVFKFSPDGKVLMTIGRAGGATGPTECCWQPNDVVTNAAGEIFVAEGHGTNPNDRIIKFSKEGKFLQAWGKRGSGPSEFNQPHALAFDSQGRLFVGDRANNRVLVFDRNMNQVADWPQFSRPSGIFIDKNDMLYSADSESGGINPAHGNWTRGIRIGSAKDGKVTAIIPDPLPTCGPGVQNEPGKPPVCGSGTWVAEGVAVDNAGNVYGAEVGPRKLTKYVKK